MLIHLKYGVKHLYPRPLERFKKKKWVLKLIKPETSLEAKMTKLKVSSCTHNTHAGLFRKDNSAGANRRYCSGRRRPNLRWVDLVEEATA